MVKTQDAADGYLFFVGAGASHPWPSGLPLFAELRAAVVAGLDPRLSNRIGYVAPEPLLRALVLAGLPVERLLLETFNSCAAMPNAVHYTLAHRLLRGDVVWTTNYDTLIEDALRHLAPSSSEYDDARRRLRQPHGRFVRDVDGEWTSSEGLIFQADQVLADWPESEAAALRAAASGQGVVLLGYSGANSYWALRKALRTSRDVQWFWYLAPDHTQTPA